jgi:hypothetical protein
MARQRVSEQEAKAAHLAKMSEVAHLIVRPVPFWLPEVLSEFSFDVRSQHSIDEIWPTRKELWSLLARGRNLAIELQNVLQHFAVSGFLVTNSKLESETSLQNLTSELSKFTACAAEASKSRLLVGKNGKPLAGGGIPHLPGVMPAKYICAAIISEVISFFVAVVCRSQAKQSGKSPRTPSVPHTSAFRHSRAQTGRRRYGSRCALDPLDNLDAS